MKNLLKFCSKFLISYFRPQRHNSSTEIFLKDFDCENEGKFFRSAITSLNAFVRQSVHPSLSPHERWPRPDLPSPSPPISPQPPLSPPWAFSPPQPSSASLSPGHPVIGSSSRTYLTHLVLFSYFRCDCMIVSFFILGQSRPTAGKAQTGSLGQDTVLWCSQPKKTMETNYNP